MLKGKVALVTGSTSGIGLAIAKAMAAQGADVMINGFGEAAAVEKERSGLAKQYGVKCVYSPADLSKSDQVTAMVAQCEKELGRVDILVNNAGIQHTAAVEDFPPEKWEQILAINLSANFYAVRAALPGMKKRNWGRIINIASAHGLVASVHKAAYVAAKHGVLGLSKVIALETATTGVTCNSICPGWVLTPMVEKQIKDRAAAGKISFDQAKHDLLSEKMPSGEAATPEQMAGAAVFLCSPSADQIRGIALPIDGGWTAQ